MKKWIIQTKDNGSFEVEADYYMEAENGMEFRRKDSTDERMDTSEVAWVSLTHLVFVREKNEQVHHTGH